MREKSQWPPPAVAPLVVADPQMVPRGGMLRRMVSSSRYKRSASSICRPDAAPLRVRVLLQVAGVTPTGSTLAPQQRRSNASKRLPLPQGQGAMRRAAVADDPCAASGCLAVEAQAGGNHGPTLCASPAYCCSADRRSSRVPPLTSAAKTSPTFQRRGCRCGTMVVPIIAKPLPLIAPNLLTSTTEGRPDMPAAMVFAAPPQCRPQATADQRLQDQLHGWTASLARLVLEVDAQAIIPDSAHGRRQVAGDLKCQRAAFESDRQRAAANVRRCRRGEVPACSQPHCCWPTVR